MDYGFYLEVVLFDLMFLVFMYGWVLLVMIGVLLVDLIVCVEGIGI